MLNILHIIPNLCKGGAERLVIDIIRELAKKSNVSIRLVLFENKIEYDVTDILSFIQIIPSNIELSITKRTQTNIQQLQHFIDDFKPNIIHSHLFEAEIVSRTCFYHSAKWFSHCHSNMNQFRNFNFKTLLNKRYLTNFYEKKYLFKSYNKNGGTRFIAISEDVNIFLEKTTKPFKILMLPNAIEYKRFLTENDYPKEKLIFTNVGALDKNKNQTFLIEVMMNLTKKGVDFEMNFLGEGLERECLEEQIKAYNLQNKIFLKGIVSNVEDYLKEASIYLHSAKSEAFGLTLIEAMAAGLPVITLDGNGNRDLIEQGKNGYMIYKHDAENFAETIINLWNNKKKYLEMSVYAKQFAKQFDINDYCAKLIKLYKASLSEINTNNK